MENEIATSDTRQEERRRLTEDEKVRLILSTGEINTIVDNTMPVMLIRSLGSHSPRDSVAEFYTNYLSNDDIHRRNLDMLRNRPLLSGTSSSCPYLGDICLELTKKRLKLLYKLHRVQRNCISVSSRRTK